MKPQVLLASGLAAALLASAAPSRAGTLHIGVVFASHAPSYGYAGGDAYRTGYDRGRDAGFEEGVRDARRRQRYGFADESAYRHGARGYRHEYGPKPRYVAGFRTGFEESYRRGYRSVYAARHHHPGHSAWCYDRHGRDDDRYDDRYDRYDRYDRDAHYGRNDNDERDERRCDPRYERCER